MSHKRVIWLITAVLGVEAALFGWLNSPHVVEARMDDNGEFLVVEESGWPAVFRGEKWEEGFGSPRRIIAHRDRTLRQYFDVWALLINLGVAVCILALSYVVLIAINARRYTLKSLFATTLLAAVLCALIAAARGVHPPPGW